MVNKKKAIANGETKKRSKLEIAIFVVALLTFGATIFFGVLSYNLMKQQLPTKPIIKVLEGPKQMSSGELILRSCIVNSCDFKMEETKKYEIISNESYILNPVYITNEGKSTSDLNLIIGCNFDVVGITHLFPSHSPEVEIKMVQAHNYKSALKIEKVSLSDLIVLELIQKGEVVNPKCEFIYSSFDIEHGEETINFEEI